MQRPSGAKSKVLALNCTVSQLHIPAEAESTTGALLGATSILGAIDFAAWCRRLRN